jgi:hypothetical protein
MGRDHDYEYIKKLEAERNKRLPPGSRWHVYWCAIFDGSKRSFGTLTTTA